MTIASEITALQNNLMAAKNAVTAKGGTVGDTGLAGLADEIDSIPSGGGGEDWGNITFSDNGTPTTVTMADQTDYMKLCQTGVTAITVGGKTFAGDSITSIALGPSASFAPHGFLRSHTGLTTITGTDNIKMAGNDCFYGCTSLNCQLDFSNLVNIGNNFLNGCTSLNSEIKFSRLTYIGQYFMSGCTSFAKKLVIPSGLTYVDLGFMFNCDSLTQLEVNSPTTGSKIKTSSNTLSTQTSTAPMYVTGITLTGAAANTYKNRFANSTSSPYRKLILGT